MRLTRNLALPIAVLALGAFSNLSQAQTTPATVVNQTYSGSFPATISGTLPSNNTVLEEAFTLGAASDVSAYTTSYATGGFEPSVILYGPDGVSVAASVAGGPGATSTPALDQQFSAMDLGAGKYTLAVMDHGISQSLTASTIADGFIAESGTAFVDDYSNTRTGAYSIDLSVVPSATGTPGTPGTPGTATPEPATAWLVLLPALAIAGVYGRKHFAASQKI